ncbi:MAG TPA: hypothetical protein VI685_23290 [Candidatus Angelobacter sp.]
MITRVDKLPTVLTSFGYRSEYIGELEGMIPTVREHHPDWPIVVGRGHVPGFEMPTLEVESPSGKCHWSLPIPLNLDGSIEASEKDWAKIALMKPWWIAEVWRNLKKFICSPVNRLVWLDADARLNGPLDIELDPHAEIIAGPWFAGQDVLPEREHICGGFLLFQGKAGGIVETLVSQWSQQCTSYIQNLPPAPPPGDPSKARDDDQKVLTDLLKGATDSHLLWLKLDWQKYCGVPDDETELPRENALIDQWMMNVKMRLPEDRDLDWPPPEEARRRHIKDAV